MEQSPTRYLNPLLRLLWSLTGWVLVIAIITLSLIPIPSPELSARQLDKVAHCLTYATLMIWFVQMSPRRRWFVIALRLLAMGAILELLQSKTDYRTFSYWDMAANTLGVLIGWGGALLGLSTLLTRLEAKLARADRTGKPLEAVLKRRERS